jgi:uncharacterized protein YeaO (DUF488 family)
MVPLRQQTMRAVAAYEGDTRTEGFFEKGERAVIKLKRAYDSASNDDGIRFLVERLWPRGVKKAALRLDAWLKDVAPSTGLRQWFSHDPAKWAEFQRRYRRELDAKREALEPILKAARRGRVTLVYSSHDAEHNNAVALKPYLAVKMSGRGGAQRAA